MLQEHLVRCHIRHVLWLLGANGRWLNQMSDVGRHGGLFLHLGNHEPLLGSHLDMLIKCLLLQITLCRLVALVLLFGDLGNLCTSRT